MLEWIFKFFLSEDNIRYLFALAGWETTKQIQERIQREQEQEAERIQREQEAKERIKLEQSKEVMKSLFYYDGDKEDWKRELGLIDKMTTEAAKNELNRIMEAMDVLSKDPEEEKIRQQKLNEINEAMDQLLGRNILQTISNNQNNYAEVDDISKIIDPKHVKKDRGFEQIDGCPLPKKTLTGQVYKFKKTVKEGEEKQDKHEKIWYAKTSSPGEVAKGIGMSYLFPGAAKYRLLSKPIDGKNVVSQEIKGQSLAQYCENLDLEYKKLASRKWLYLSGDLTRRDDVLDRMVSDKYLNTDFTGHDNYLDIFYSSNKMLPFCIDKLIRVAKLTRNEKYNVQQNCKNYLLLASNIEAVFQNNESDDGSEYGDENELVNNCPFAYYLTDTQNKELLRASFYNYVTGNLDVHGNNLILTEDGQHVIPIDFDLLHRANLNKTLSSINDSKRYLGQDKFKEYIQEFIGDLERKQDQYHDIMKDLCVLLEIKDNKDKMEIIQENIENLKELAGISIEEKKQSWKEFMTLDTKEEYDRMQKNLMDRLD